MCGKIRGFTLIELLVVIAIIAILAAIIFPVFASARTYSKSAGCLSNLKQIALAFSLYQRDWNDELPYGLDASDYYAIGAVWANWWDPSVPKDEWDGVRVAYAELAGRPNRGGMLDQVLRPYTRTTEVWHCPADIGVGFLNLATSPSATVSGEKSCYEAFHMSYGYRTSLALLHRRVGSLLNPAETDLLSDNAGYWHTRFQRAPRSSNDTSDSSKWSYHVLFADGHCRAVNQQEMDKYWTWGRVF